MNYIKEVLKRSGKNKRLDLFSLFLSFLSFLACLNEGLCVEEEVNRSTTPQKSSFTFLHGNA